MVILVVLGAGATEVIKDGNSWEVTDHGHLNVYTKKNELVATFASGQWLAVKEGEIGE